jgi:hypothetical protein
VDSSAGGSEPAGVAQDPKPNVPIRISIGKGRAGDDIGCAAHGRSRRPGVREIATDRSALHLLHLR